jgi:hypothetical protein
MYATRNLDAMQKSALLLAVAIQLFTAGIATTGSP